MQLRLGNASVFDLIANNLKLGEAMDLKWKLTISDGKVTKGGNICRNGKVETKTDIKV